MNHRGYKFSIVPRLAASDRELTANDYRTLIVIAGHANAQGIATGIATTAIATESGMARQRISESTTRLVARGWLTKEGGGGRSRPCRYQIRTPDWASENCTRPTAVSLETEQSCRTVFEETERQEGQFDLETERFHRTVSGETVLLERSVYGTPESINCTDSDPETERFHRTRSVLTTTQTEELPPYSPPPWGETVITITVDGQTAPPVEPVLETEPAPPKLTRPKRQQTAERFADFWATYPRKQGKQAALKTWKARGLDAIADEIIADVRLRWQREWRWKDRQYIPHGSTYLNQQRWEDEIEDASHEAEDRRANRPGAGAAAERPLWQSPAEARHEAVMREYFRRQGLEYPGPGVGFDSPWPDDKLDQSGDDRVIWGEVVSGH